MKTEAFNSTPDIFPNSLNELDVMPLTSFGGDGASLMEAGSLLQTPQVQSEVVSGGPLPTEFVAESKISECAACSVGGGC